MKKVSTIYTTIGIVIMVALLSVAIVNVLHREYMYAVCNALWIVVGIMMIKQTWLCNKLKEDYEDMSEHYDRAVKALVGQGEELRRLKEQQIDAMCPKVGVKKIKSHPFSKGRAVSVKTPDGEIIEYPSLQSAARGCGVARTVLTRDLQMYGSVLYKGYLFMLHDDNPTSDKDWEDVEQKEESQSPVEKVTTSSKTKPHRKKEKRQITLNDIKNNPDLFLTTDEVKRALGISDVTLYRWRKEKLIRSYKIGGVFRYKPEDVLKMVEDV